MGTVLRESAPVDETITYSSNSIPGKDMGSIFIYIDIYEYILIYKYLLIFTYINDFKESLYTDLNDNL